MYSLHWMFENYYNLSTVAILAKATVRLYGRPLGRTADSPPSMPLGPHELLAQLHGDLLRLFSQEVHFQGLPMAGRHYLKAGVISKRFYRKLSNLDVTFHVVRHITTAYASQLVKEAEHVLTRVHFSGGVHEAEPGQR